MSDLSPQPHADRSDPLPAPIRWESPTGRYYIACLYRDLFGTLVVSRYWGGMGKAGGGQRHEPVASLDAGLAKLAEIDRIRTKHGYRCVSAPTADGRGSDFSSQFPNSMNLNE